MRTAHVVIVGGGVIGCSIAYHLVQAGARDIVVIERHQLAGGATGICPGGIRQQFDGEAECRFARRSVRFFEQANDILEPDMPFRFERSGYLFLADSDTFLRALEERVRRQSAWGVPSEILGTTGIASLVPALDCTGVVGAAYCREDGFLEDCDGITTWLARRACQHGARVEYDEVARIEQRSRRWLVVTGRDSIEVEHVVLAAGVWTGELVPASVDLPIRVERRRLMYTQRHPAMMLRPLAVSPERGVAAKQLSNGTFYLGWLRESATDDDAVFTERALALGATLLPVFGEIGVRRLVTGWYDQTPDSRPILGSLPGLPGLHVAAGFSGHGFMLAPAVGQAMSDVVLGRPTDLPIDAFSIARFSDPTVSEAMMI